MSIYKANDIRGRYGKELNDKDAYALGNAFVRHMKCSRVVVGRDNRLSSPALYKELVKGITHAGADVLDIGMVDSPGFYFATSYLECPGIMITASHNPAPDNGFYICDTHARPINEVTGLKRIEHLAKLKAVKVRKKGAIFMTPLMRPYVKHVLSYIRKETHKPFTVVIDAGNGMGAPIATRVFAGLRNITVVPLYYESDGRFPHHGPDPSKPENMQDLGKKVLEVEADFGIALDGDADRAGFVDEHGEPVEGSLVGALLAEHLLKHHAREKIVYSSTCSRILPETIKKNKGIPLRDKVGHTFIKTRMKKEHALFGIEDTGHYMYRENDYADSGIITALVMCELYSQQKASLSTLLRPLRKYHKTHTAYATPHAHKKMPSIIKAIRTLKPKSINTDDGIAADFGSYWVSIRASQTEPLIRLVVEGTSREVVEKQKTRFLELITKHI